MYPCLLTCLTLLLVTSHVTAPSSVRFKYDTEETVNDEGLNAKAPERTQHLHNLLQQSFSRQQNDGDSTSVRRSGAFNANNGQIANHVENHPLSQPSAFNSPHNDQGDLQEPLFESSNYENEIERTNDGNKLTQKKATVHFTIKHDIQANPIMRDAPASPLNRAETLQEHHLFKAAYNTPLSQDEGRTLNDQFNNLWEAVEGVYWSPQLERTTPTVFSDNQTSQWRYKIDNGMVDNIMDGCGRMQNRLVLFKDGTKVCARYRINNDQIQGEIYTYYLAKAIGISNVPPAFLDKADSSVRRWSEVQNSIDKAQWSPRKPLVLTPYVDNLKAAYIPLEFRSDERYLAADTHSLVNKTVSELVELVQWSDLIILDYITANVDRVVNNMFNLQWSPNIMSAPTHNLERMEGGGPLIFMDNESGLVHSYRLLEKYSNFHEILLKSLCMFRKDTASKIKMFHKTGSLPDKIKELFRDSEPLSEKLAPLPAKSYQILNQRLAAVYKQIKHCEHLYGTR